MIKIISISYFLLILTLGVNCQSKKKELMKIDFNEVNSITGVYTKCFLSQKNDTTHYGYYKIVVNDTLEIILLPPYLKEAKRSKSEIDKFEGKEVIVTGKITEYTFLDKPTIDNSPQKVNVPCFIIIESIELIQ